MDKEMELGPPLSVEITVVPGGTQLGYSPAVLQIGRQDRVQWHCAAGPFVIQFQRGTPLGRVHHHPDPTAPLYSSAALPIAQGVPAGRYPYAVAICHVIDGVPTAVYIDAGCPEIIIED